LNQELEERVVERTAALAALAESEHRFRTLVEAAPIGACIIDDSGVFETVNAAFAALYGYGREELLGGHSALLVPQEQQSSARKEPAPRVNESAVQHEYEVVTKQQQRLTVLVSTVEITVADGRPSRAAFVLDISAQAQALRDAERARTAAEDLARLRSDFVAAVSHELRTPLAASIGFAELLQARWTQMDDDQRLNLLGKIVLAANRQRRMVEDLLLLNRLEVGILEVHCEPVALALAVQRAADEVRANYRDQRIDLTGPSDLLVLAEPDRTLQVLVILLDNAAKYSREGRPVAVAWEATGSTASIRVRDRGPGIPRHGYAHLFTRFGRVPGSRARAGRVGTGLGLYLGRQLAQAMSGELELESTGPEGSTFRLRLPLASGGLASPAGTAAPA
jgi:PAS domain S-box-containing protein